MPPTNWPRSATPHAPPILRSRQSHPPPSSWPGDRCMGQFRWRAQNRRVVWGIALLVLFRFIWAATINLSPQEAYYWNYAMHPALSYLDHPPMVAWVIRAGTLSLGKSEIGVRIGGLLLVVVSTWVIYALGRLWFSRRAGLWAALLFQVIPVYFIYGVLITPDVPLICFWLLTMYLVSIAVLRDRPAAWYGAGAALGFAMLSKYTALFLVPSALLFLIADRGHRKWLLRKEPYLAFFLSLVIFSPVILWNYQHQWASFSFQFGRRLLAEVYQGHAFDPELLINPARHSFIESVGMQLGAIFPTFLAVLVLSFAVAVYFTIKGQGSRWKFCLFFSFPILVFFAVYSIGSKVNANWPLPGYLALLIAAHTCYRYLRFKSGRGFKIAQRKMLVFSLYGLPVLCVSALFHMTLVIPFVPATQFTGWRELGKTVEREKATLETEKGKTTFILGMDRYNITSELAFYMQNFEDVFSRKLLGKNALGFEFWDSRVPRPGSNALAVNAEFPPDIGLLQKHFIRVDEQVTVVPIVRRGKIVRRFYVARCYDYLNPNRTLTLD